MMSSQKSPLSSGTLDGSSHKQGKHNDEASYMSLHSHRRSSGLSNQQLLKQLHNGTSDLPSKIQQVNADTRSQRQRPLNGRLKPVENQTQKDNKSNQFENTFPVNRQGTSILTTPSSWEKRLPVNGQGTLIITKNTQTPFLLSVENEKGHYRIILKIEKDQVSFIKCIGDKDEVLSSVRKKGSGIEDGKISYWFSYDRDNLVLKYGKGYLMEETTILVHDFLQVNKPQEGMKIRENLHPYFNAEDKKFVRKYELLDFVKYGGGLGVNAELVEFEKDPFNTNISPLVMDSSKVNLFYLDEGNYIFSASLPVACRELYENIKGCCLNYSQEVTGVLLSDAIRYSLETKGCILNTRLEEKASGFGKRDIQGTYLRITLGQRLGKSPGVPYVLEIWPKGHYSPVHNHGNANAIIKVLFGSIHFMIYNKHVCATDSKPLKEFDAMKDDITWVDRNWYQTHKLINKSNDFCATIQCYNYDPEDKTHWPYFDYISNNENMAEFMPDSDFGFREMHENIVMEYKGRSIK